MSANWIPDINRFNLPKPPTWFLNALWDQDAGLVLIPSRYTPKYLIARRRSASSTIAKIVTNTNATHFKAQTTFSDGDMLSALGLVIVDSLTGNVYQGTWSHTVLAELRSRDMWAAGGADAYITKLESQEQKARDAQRRTLVDDMDHRARDAWKSYQARTGQRTRIDDTGIRRTSRAKIIQVGTL